MRVGVGAGASHLWATSKYCSENSEITKEEVNSSVLFTAGVNGLFSYNATILTDELFNATPQNQKLLGQKFSSKAAYVYAFIP